MPSPATREVDQNGLNAVLDELCRAVGADGGASLYLADGDGVLQQAATTLGGDAGATGLLQRMLGRGTAKSGQRTLVLSLPDSANFKYFGTLCYTYLMHNNFLRMYKEIYAGTWWLILRNICLSLEVLFSYLFSFSVLEI